MSARSRHLVPASDAFTAPSLSRMRAAFITLLGALALHAHAQLSPPDFTKGEAIVDAKGAKVDPLEKDINLGPTGAQGWVFHKSVDSGASRQILVTVVAPGSPADGTLAAGDVIL
ncbi:MAG TPA: hypothetical protein VFY13_03485, partial [Luteolibacter sp.]|nr:hypothetical protein [Luteolibacter sp.]